MVAKNSDWFITPFAPVLIGQIKYHKTLFVFPMVDWEGSSYAGNKKQDSLTSLHSMLVPVQYQQQEYFSLKDHVSNLVTCVLFVVGCV